MLMMLRAYSRLQMITVGPTQGLLILYKLKLIDLRDAPNLF